MRAPLQIIALPYQLVNGFPLYCVFRRSDCEAWQFLSGGAEDSETPAEAAVREIMEESGISLSHDSLLPLTSMCYIPANIFCAPHWPKDLYVVPEYSFAFLCTGEITLSHEHLEYRWLPFLEARKLLTYDSNKTALYELNERLKRKESL